MNCDLCGKTEATVHITQTFDDQVTRVDLCEPCAKKAGVNDPTGMSLATLMEAARKRKREGSE